MQAAKDIGQTVDTVTAKRVLISAIRHGINSNALPGLEKLLADTATGEQVAVYLHLVAGMDQLRVCDTVREAYGDRVYEHTYGYD